MDEIDQDNSKSVQNPERSSEELNQFIRVGLELIKKGNFRKAIDYFKDEKEAGKFGFFLTPGRSYYLNEVPNPGEIKVVLGFLALSSHFSQKGENVMEIAGIDVAEGIEGNSVIKGLYHESALVHAEEWLHGLQKKAGKPLTGNKDLEADIAVYMHALRVPLTKTFLDNSPGRDSAIRRFETSRK